jgi:hypothetical protein
VRALADGTLVAGIGVPIVRVCMVSAGLAAGRPGRAVRLLAAADALLQAAGTGWLLAYAATAPSDDYVLPGLRSRMGDATLQEAWAQGAATGRQRAGEYALQD